MVPAFGPPCTTATLGDTGPSWPLELMISGVGAVRGSGKRRLAGGEHHHRTQHPERRIDNINVSCPGAAAAGILRDGRSIRHIVQAGIHDDALGAETGRFLPAGQSARRTDAGRFEIACRNAAQADARGGFVQPVVDEEELFVRGIIVGQYPPAAFAEQKICRVQGIGDSGLPMSTSLPP